MEAALYGHGNDIEPERGDVHGELSRPFGVRASRDADEDAPGRHQHVAAVERAGTRDAREPPMRPQRLGHRVHFRAPRRRPRPRQHRQFVEHDRGVFDEYRIRQLGGIRQALHAAAGAPKRLLVGRVLLHRARIVDRRPLDVGELASSDAYRDSSRERDDLVIW
jgi:hypothetical protein